MCVVIGLIAISASADDGTEEAVKLKDCPKAVQRTLKRESNGGKIVEIEKEQEDGETIYEAEVMIDGKEYDVEITDSGTLLSKVLENEQEDEDAEDEDTEDEDADEGEEEVEVKQSDLPRTVRKTLRREARGGKIEEIERERENGKTIYEAEVEIDGKEYEIEIASDGTLLSKELDDGEEDDEEEDDEEDGDDDDKD
jgi:uncharacterized membrane protein YkoI